MRDVHLCWCLCGVAYIAINTDIFSSFFNFTHIFTFDHYAYVMEWSGRRTGQVTWSAGTDSAERQAVSLDTTSSLTPTVNWMSELSTLSMA